VTGPFGPGRDSMVLIQPFPQPGRLAQLAYRELDLATSRQQDHLLPLRDLANVPRPWTSAPARRRIRERRFGRGWRLSSPG